jgi:6,7-dimethyl-8-ribityllumazine synthase
MAGRGQRSVEASELPAVPAAGQGAHILIIEAPYYEAISVELAKGAIAELDAARATYERIVVPGALEIPQALAQAVKAGVIGSDEINARFDGCIVLTG